MSTLRILVLALLCVLLPVRGAMAATMSCPGGAGAPASSTNAGHVGHAGHEHHNASAMHADHVVEHHPSGAEARAADASGIDHPTTCHFCAAGCCMASLPAAVPLLGEPALTGRAIFPALTARAMAFQSDGQERPPRAI